MPPEPAAIVQGDRSVLVEVDHPGYERAREVLARFAEIEKSPEHIHTYRVSDLSLWNAAAAGIRAEEVLEGLRSISRYSVPTHIEHEIAERMARHGVCSLHDVPRDPRRLRLAVDDELVHARLASDRRAGKLLRPGPGGFTLAREDRGQIKQVLLRMGYPVADRAGLVDGKPLDVALRSDVFSLYPYQQAAVRAFLESGGHGVVSLACGGGKTVIALGAMAELGTRTLVIVTGREAASQWKREIETKTTLAPEYVAVYDSKTKDVGPVTITTYSMLARRGGEGPTQHVHFDRLAGEGWGLIIYDEVHLLPAPVFRLTAELQAHRRLGLTATLVREDGRAGDVFALIGPKRFDVPWRELEASGHIAEATCYEVRVELDPALEAEYASVPLAEQPRVAAGNPRKLAALEAIAARHAGDRVLVFGTYLQPLERAAKALGLPLVSGATPHAERERLYEAFRRGELRSLALSRVGNFAIDLPDANVLVQLSGTMGSRQEEAQRLGRLLRPKPGGARFYSLVTRDTVEQEHALRRQLFLAEQGYRFYIEDHDEGATAATSGGTDGGERR